VDSQTLYPGLLQTRRQLDRDPLAGSDATADLHHDRHPRLGGYTGHRAGDRHGLLGIVQERRARTGLHHLAHGATHVDVEDVGDHRAGEHDLGRPDHDVHCIPEELHCERPLFGHEAEVLGRPDVTVDKPVGADHLGRDQPDPVRFEVAPVGSGGESRHGSQYDPVGDVHLSDAERHGQRRPGVRPGAPLYLSGTVTVAAPRHPRNDCACR